MSAAEMIMNGQMVKVYSEGIDSDNWQDFIVGGEKIGQVNVVRQTEDARGVLTAGLWRHRPEEHPNGMPYGVEGHETFYVIEGEAEIETPNGDIIFLNTGSAYSFSKGFVGTWKTKKPFIKFFVEN